MCAVSIPLFTEETFGLLEFSLATGGMNGLFEVRTLKVFLWDIYTHTHIPTCSLSLFSDSVMFYLGI